MNLTYSLYKCFNLQAMRELLTILNFPISGKIKSLTFEEVGTCITFLCSAEEAKGNFKLGKI